MSAASSRTRMCNPPKRRPLVSIDATLEQAKALLFLWRNYLSLVIALLVWLSVVREREIDETGNTHSRVNYNPWRRCTLLKTITDIYVVVCSIGHRLREKWLPVNHVLNVPKWRIPTKHVVQDPRFLLNSVSPCYRSTKHLYILQKLTRIYRNSAEIGGLVVNMRVSHKIERRVGRPRKTDTVLCFFHDLNSSKISCFFRTSDITRTKQTLDD